MVCNGASPILHDQIWIPPRLSSIRLPSHGHCVEPGKVVGQNISRSCLEGSPRWDLARVQGIFRRWCRDHARRPHENVHPWTRWQATCAMPQTHMKMAPCAGVCQDWQSFVSFLFRYRRSHRYSIRMYKMWRGQKKLSFMIIKETEAQIEERINKWDKFLEEQEDAEDAKKAAATLYTMAMDGSRIAAETRRDPNLVMQNGDAPLHTICNQFGDTTTTRGGNGQVVKYLLKLGADPNLADESGFSPLHVVSKDLYDDAEFLTLFCDASKEVNRRRCARCPRQERPDAFTMGSSKSVSERGRCTPGSGRRSVQLRFSQQELFRREIRIDK
ncbi:unnamed protein product [Trichogramma brassicae]|uniref:Uncharacterized protein n=1 Tax=Trichogramma brassicae TaxID=86971 RepID=A0A6H5I5N3_9HYME|nr:unnamed protein product [Trichogramma brassicae]